MDQEMSASKCMESGSDPGGVAIRIVQFEMRENRASRMSLGKTVLKDVLKSIGDREIALISITGPTRKGKSFLMSYLVSFLQTVTRNVKSPIPRDEHTSTTPLKGFPYKNGYDRETVGIYIWSEPFILQRSDGSEVAVLLMDTQGVFDEQTGEREWSGIIGLSMLTSSCLIYNIFNDLQEDVFVMLNTFMRQGLRTIDDDEKKCFQKLIFVIRDWNNPAQYRYGPTGGKLFIDEKLKTKTNTSKESRESRLILTSCFEEVDCFLFPPPGERAKLLDFSGSNSELEPNFIDNVKCFVEALLLNPDDIPSKRIGNSLITGNTLCSYFEKFVETFNKSTSNATFQEALIHGSCAAAEIQSLEKYKSHMKTKMEACDLFAPQDLFLAHQECSKLSKEYFQSQKILGDAQHISHYKNSLEANIEKIFQDNLAILRSNRAEHAKSWIDESANSFELELSTLSDGTKVYMADNFEDILEVAKKTALGKFATIAGNQDKDFFSEFIPQLIERLDIIQNKFRTQNNQILDGARDTCNNFVEAALSKYRKKVTELGFTGSTYFDEDGMLHLNQMGVAAAIKHFERGVVMQFVDNQLQKKFRNELEGRMTLEFENIVRQNAEIWSSEEKRRADKLNSLIQDHSKTVVAKINSDEICEHEKLSEFHRSSWSSLKSQFISECQIKHVAELQEFEGVLTRKLDEVHEQAKSELSKRQVQAKQTSLQAMATATQDYSSRFSDVLKKTAQIAGPEDMNKIHQKISQALVNKIILPVHFSKSERSEFHAELGRCLLEKYAEAKQHNANKMQEAEKYVEQLCESIAQEYEKNIIESDAQNLSEIELQSVRESSLRISKQEFLSKITCFGGFAQDQLLAIFSKNIIEVENKITNYINKKQLELDEEIKRFSNSSLNLYNAEMEQRVDLDSQHKQKKIELAHTYVEEKAIQEFEHNMKKWQIKSRRVDTFKQQLITDIRIEYARRVKSNSILLEKFNAETKRLMETSFQDYKTKMDTQVNAMKSADELNTFHTSLKHNTITEFLASCTGVEELKTALGENIQSYFEESIRPQFIQFLQRRMESVRGILKTSKEKYFSTMASQLEDNIIHETGVLQNAHEMSLKTAIDNFRHSIHEILSTTEATEYEHQLQSEIRNEFANFQTKQQNILEGFQGSAEFHLNKMVEEYKKASDNVFKNAKNAKAFHEDLEKNIDLLTREFSRLCNFPLKSLETEFTARLQQALENEVRYFEDKFKESEIKPEKLKTEVDMAIRSYKSKMDRLIGRTTKHIEVLKLNDFHNKSVTCATEDLKERKIRITETVETALQTALLQIFKIYLDENSLKVESETPAIGIDLGTTYSCVAVYTKGRVEVIPNEFRDKITPSYVRYTQDGVVDMVGKPAKNQAYETPRMTIFDVKRLIGRRFTDKTVQDDMRLWPFKVVRGGSDMSTPQIEVGSKTFPPEKVSSEVLKNLKKMAETFLGKPVTRAVITVPAYFDDGQRQATKDAGKLAGLEVLGILNEPTAAAIAYSLQHTDEQVRNVLIYDFGGGTFDVAILKMAGGTIEVKAVGGDTHLGGEDIDTRLVDYCVAEFNRQHGIDLSALPPNSTNVEIEARSRRLRRIRHTCESRKCDLSGECSKVTVTAGAIHGQLDLHVDITRDKFEELNLALFEKTIQKVREAITESGVEIGGIDDVVLVGGSTKIPKVQQLLQELFDGKPLRRSVHPDEAVAFGAAIHAAILNGNWDQKKKLISLTDVTPLSLGIKTVGNEFSRVIKKNSPLPAENVDKFTTVVHNQTEIKFSVYEGESPIADQNHLLGEFLLTEIPPQPRGKETVDVTMRVDLNGILNVKAVCRSTGKEVEINIEESKGRLNINELTALM